jgi:hypothetical protein
MEDEAVVAKSMQVTLGKDGGWSNGLSSSMFTDSPSHVSPSARNCTELAASGVEVGRTAALRGMCLQQLSNIRTSEYSYNKQPFYLFGTGNPQLLT